MRKIVKAIVGITAAGVLATSVAACSSSSTSVKPVAKIDSLTGQSTSVALDAGFANALTTLKLTPGLVGTATMPQKGTLTFPITGGHVTVYPKGKVTPYVQGDIKHDGSGLSLTGGSTKVELTNFEIDPGNNSKLYGNVSVNGASKAKHADLFTLDGSTLKPITVSGNVATLTGTRVLVSATAAGLLDKVFKTTAVKAGLLVGVATLLVNLK